MRDPLWTFQDYLSVEEASPERHELCEGRVWVRPNGGPVHAEICTRVASVIWSLVRGSGCRVYGSTLRLVVEATTLATYPDVTVVCGPVKPALQDELSATNPIVLVEVLSPSTEAFDRGEKFSHYQKLPTLQDYVLVSSQRRVIDVFRRDEQGRWILSSAGPGERVSLESLGIDLVVDDIYEGVTLAPPTRGSGCRLRRSRRASRASRASSKS